MTLEVEMLRHSSCRPKVVRRSPNITCCEVTVFQLRQSGGGLAQGRVRSALVKWVIFHRILFSLSVGHQKLAHVDDSLDVDYWYKFPCVTLPIPRTCLSWNTSQYRHMFHFQPLLFPKSMCS